MSTAKELRHAATQLQATLGTQSIWVDPVCEHILATVRDDEQAAFEAWLRSIRFHFDRMPNGSYSQCSTEMMWGAWKAALGIEVQS